MNGGDQLARGAKSATFLPPQVSQEKWDQIWSEDAEVEFHTTDKTVSEPPPHCGTKVRVIEQYKS